MNANAIFYHLRRTLLQGILICAIIPAMGYAQSPSITSPLSGTYTLGSSVSADFSDFPSLILALNSYGLSGPTTINVENGTYYGQLTFGAVSGSSSINTLTIQSATGNNTAVILQFTASSSASNWTIKLNGTSYLKLKGMSIRNNGDPPYASVVVVSGSANHNTIESCRLISIISPSTQAYCIFDVTGGSAGYNTYLNNYMEGGNTTLFCHGSAVGTVVQGNEIVGSYGVGIWVYGHDAPFIAGNYIHDGVVHNANTLFLGIYTRFAGNQYRIVGNRVDIVCAQGYAFGIYDFNANNGSGPTGYGLVANNMISIRGGTGDNLGLYSLTCTGTGYSDNSILITGGSPSACAFYQHYSSSISTFKNNVLVNTGGGYAAFFGNVGVIAAMDYNDYYSSGAYLARCGNFNKTSLASLQASSGKDAHSLNVLPTFVSPSDLHVLSPELNGMGTPLTGVSTDIDGDLRNLTTPDIGADEYSILGLTPTATPTTICSGSESQLNVAVTGNSWPVSYTWSSNPAGFTSMVQNPIVSPTTTTTYTVTVTEGSSSATAQIVVTVLGIPTVNAGSDVVVYYGYPPAETATLTAMAAGNAPLTYLWSQGSTTQSITVNPHVTTTYSIEVTDINGCKASDDVTVNVIDVRCGNKMDKVMLCMVHLNNINSVCVNYHAVPALLAAGATLGPCAAQRLSGNAVEFRAYPNPTDGNLIVETPMSEGETWLSLYDMMGRVVFMVEVTQGADVLDLSGMNPGVYMLVWRNGESTQSQRIVVK